MTVDDLLQYLQRLSAEGKGKYEVTCEGFCVGTDIESIEVCDIGKKISL